MNEDLHNGLLGDVSEMKSNLIRRGLMNEDGNAINVRQLTKSTDAAAIAIVQEHDKLISTTTRRNRGLVYAEQPTCQEAERRETRQRTVKNDAMRHDGQGNHPIHAERTDR